jgi:predicted phage replisome organizer
MKLSFIKLDIDIMNDTKIKIIRKMPAGNEILVVWIGILCLGMKSGKTGVLEVGDGIPFNDELLSAELDIELSTIRLALNTFEKLKMIEYFDNGEIYITNFEKHQEIDKIEIAKEKHRLAQGKYREKQKLLLSGDYHVKNNDATELELESDKEIDIDTETKTGKVNYAASDIKAIFNKWVSYDCLIKHRQLTDTIKRAINGKLKYYTVIDICSAIENYAKVKESKEHYFNHSYELKRFLEKMDTFLTENKPFDNYRNKATTTAAPIDDGIDYLKD